jgi:Flp pilus assembly protein TadG
MRNLRQRGSTIAEGALTLGVLFLLMMGIMVMGVLFYDYQTLSNAAREGARYGVVAVNTPTPAQVAQRVCSFLSSGAAPSTCPSPAATTTVSPCVVSNGSVPTAEDVYVTTCTLSQANNVNVKVTEVDIRKNIHLPLLPAIALHTTAAMRNETN